MKKFFGIYIVFFVLITACQPSPLQIQKAIEQTQAVGISLTASAFPTATSTATLTPTITPTETQTSTPTPTFTFTPTITPTPDLRIIDIDPQKFLLKSSDLPEDGKYYIPASDWMDINTNEEVISTRGVEKGRDYVIRTGRVTGWWVEFLRDTRTVQMPEDVSVFVGQFKTASGAQLALSKYNSVETYPGKGYKYKTYPMGLGDQFNWLIQEKTTSGGDKKIYLELGFTYRNYMVIIGSYGFEKDVSYDFNILQGKKVLNKLQAAALEYPATATPTP